MFYRELGIIPSLMYLSVFTPHNDLLRWILVLFSSYKGIDEITEFVIYSLEITF